MLISNRPALLDLQVRNSASSEYLVWSAASERALVGNKVDPNVKTEIGRL